MAKFGTVKYGSEKYGSTQTPEPLVASGNQRYKNLKDVRISIVDRHKVKRQPKSQ